ncbi:class D sortase [Geobacillus icigianus]|uniref:Class D sortase n=1 Tax=Geobacillus subterraneus TaxID=129338 RepID=A0A679FSX3_9BACL|nr:MULTISPECIES: class D sortase [Geobacillus]KYD29173.1 hypothetical protein B4113_2327 [Geobacillus sp. B4113_201601]BBW97725.1 hypothetical protein GsuE55_25580 [Geobacillus subterraneus]
MKRKLATAFLSSLCPIFRCTALVLLVIGIWLVGWNGYWYMVGWKAAKPDRVLSSLKQESGSNANTSVSADWAGKRAKSSPSSALGAYLGEMTIPKLGVAIPVYEGVREQELRRGVGHYPNSAWPGGEGHVVLSGHRDTVLRRLGELGIGDAIILRTEGAAVHYRVVNVRIVDDEDRTVLVDKARPTLTVTTCYPFHFIGRAPKRYVVIARPVRVDRLKL